MNKLIDTAIIYKRTVIMLVALIIISGISAYSAIPKEEKPDVAIPILYVSTSLEGISAADADKLLASPIVRELEGIDGLEKITSTGAEGYAAINLEFDSGVDIDEILPYVRASVDKAKNNLPEAARDPYITEINVALFPVLVITMSGNVDEVVLYKFVEELQSGLEGLSGVLEANIRGERTEFAEIIVNPYSLEAYNLNLDELIGLVSSNNRLVAAGALDTGEGRFGVKVPGLLEDEQDILNLPIKVVNDKVITYRDIAVGRRTYKDALSYSRFNGESTVSVEVVKRIGENTIETIEGVKKYLDDNRGDFPEGLSFEYSSDASIGIRDSLNNLFNNIIAAAILVMIFAIMFIGFRNALLVGLSIPCSFLAAILIINMMGYTLNIVVLFALILSVGMLVDGAIVVTEYADMQMLRGVPRIKAYASAAKRMSWPIITSTSTTLAAFFPLLFWPDTIGDFMKYIPITVITTLVSALVVALIALPVLGSMIGKPNIHAHNTKIIIEASSQKNYSSIKGIAGAYLRAVDGAMHHSYRTMFIMMGMFVFIIFLYSSFGKGVKFFPDIEPDNSQIRVRARGDLALNERDEIVRQIESYVLKNKYFKSVYTTVSVGGGQGNSGAEQDLIGTIQVEFADWRNRPPATEIMSAVESELIPKFPGVILNTRNEQSGPGSSVDIEVELSSNYKDALDETVVRVTEYFENEMEGVKSVRNTKSLPSIAWEVEVDREKASRFNVNVATIGSFVQMITTGILVSDYIPEGAQEEVDIRLRFPFNERNIDRLERMRVSAKGEQIPVSNFITRVARQRDNEVTRVDGRYSYNIEIDLQDGVRPDQKIPEVSAVLSSDEIPRVVSWKFAGEQEDQQRAAAFLMNAFGVAFFMMLVILVTQFNSFRQALLVLSAIFFSTAGVFLGLLIRGESFGIVMSGMGIIALAGIVVNNNIILIDTFNSIRARGESARDAVLQTCAQRFRPVILTTVTTVMGLMPLVIQLNLNFIERDITIGAPSSQWWVQLSTAIAGGLFFATIITLFFTPSFLYRTARKEDNAAGRKEVITKKSRLQKA
ncbi:MAG: efflux RND transporter permease subunit [Candidatus Portiera sp.]|nr:efflux RND transporter permease subunit [Portiera sp.]